MPSDDEIRCSRAEYLPGVDPTQWHLPGIDGLLDRNFRLLREDTVGQLRDTVRHEIMPDAKQTKSPLRKFVHHGLRLLDLGFHWFSGLYFVVDFPQPSGIEKYPIHMRQTWWEESRRLRPGDLVCLVIQKDLILFCTVADQVMRQTGKKGPKLPQKSESTSLWSGEKRASVKLKLVDSRFTNTKLILDVYGHKEPPMSLIEFPGVLLASFEPSLKAIQCMKAKKNLPFSDLLVSWALNPSSSPVTSTPLYASHKEFAYNLRCLLNTDVDFYVHPGDTQTQGKQVQYLEEHSTLDHGQALALINCLNRRLGLIQGPPGTGKSYTGVALIKVLLANRDVGNLGPIICVTYTNHALDQLLEALLDHKVTSQIVRVGSQSKSEKLDEFSLSAVSKWNKKTDWEKQEISATTKRLSYDELEFDAIGIQKQVSPSRLKPHILQHHSRHGDQLFAKTQDDSITHSSSSSKPASQDPIELWMDSGMWSDAPPRSAATLENIDVFDMSQQERVKMYGQWCRELRDDEGRKVTQLVESHKASKIRFDAIEDKMHLRCLNQAEVIGITTSGLARRHDMFQRLQSKVMICEEAGEVLEPHMLSAFLPSVEYAILIGDQEQLRPQVQSHHLSSENVRGGGKYSLDVSLFERLVSLNKTPISCGYSYSTLEVQRRMHPEISRLVRDTLYPHLEDSLSTKSHPNIRGMRRRLFWLDHRAMEDSQENTNKGAARSKVSMDDLMSTSHWNNHEIEMTTALIQHLVRQNYMVGDIAVLTPYLNQLHKLRHRLAREFPITVGDRDQVTLAHAGYVNSLKPKDSTQAQQGTLRVATVDNFQGEEAKIVVISLVRSNIRNQCGFLRTSNRINVLLSRAQHGMYIIGNSETSRHVPMWNKVLDILRQGQNIGQALELMCPRHPETVIKVTIPKDFAKLSPQGGCNQRCNKPMACGHLCSQRCHSESAHNAAICLEACRRPLDGCTHKCPIPCGRACPNKCLVNTNEVLTLACGHFLTKALCWQAQNASSLPCGQRVTKTVPGCNHSITTSCSANVESPNFKCNSQCMEPLPCGHKCKNICHQCVARMPGKSLLPHGKCKERCDRKLSACDHTCTLPCHGDDPCPPCLSACGVRCGHSECQRQCVLPCTPCKEKCLSGCFHSGCSLPCAAPCNHIPCSKRCTKRLQCGHQCPSTCGEKCPAFFYCQICGNRSIQDQIIDAIGQKYRKTNLHAHPCLFPECGHIVTIEYMDALMKMALHYKLNGKGKPVSLRDTSALVSAQDITCATCLQPFKGVVRYRRLERQAVLQESAKKLIVLANRVFIPLAEALPGIVKAMSDTKPQAESKWPEVIEIGGTRWDQIKTMRDVVYETNPERWDAILGLRERIEWHRRLIQPEEEALQRVQDVLRNSLDDSNKCSLSSIIGVLQTKVRLQVNALLNYLDTSLLANFSVVMYRAQTFQTFQASQAWNTTLKIDLQTFEDDCILHIHEATSQQRIYQQAEGYVHLALVHAFERKNCSSPERKEVLAQQIRDNVARARALCNLHPNQTQGLASQLNSVVSMLAKNAIHTLVTTKHRISVTSNMPQEIRKTEKWRHCVHGHMFTKGECEEAYVCPECGARIEK